MYCKCCKSKMTLDDKDIISKGNFDKYWTCGNCNAFCLEIVRGYKTSKLVWDEGEVVVPSIDSILNF